VGWPPDANSLILSSELEGLEGPSPLSQDGVYFLPPLLNATLTREDSVPSGCPAALGSRPPAESASLMGVGGVNHTPGHTPLHRQDAPHATGTCQRPTAAAISAFGRRQGCQGPRVPGTEGAPCPRLQAWVLEEGGSLSRRLGWLPCQSQRPHRRGNQVISLKPCEQNFLTFYLHCSVLKVALRFSQR